jgi:thiamine biosynthesis lipoprotein
MEQVQFRAMGTDILVVIDAEPQRARKSLAWAHAHFLELERRLSRFRPESELSALNRRAGTSVRVSQPLYDALAAGLRAAHTSNGLVTPTLLREVTAAGYDRSFELLADSSPAPVAKPAISKQSQPIWQQIRMNPERRRVWLPLGAQIDLGGIAKGWAADQIVQRLADIGPSLVDAGGDIAISGLLHDGTTWPIGVANPLQPGQLFGVLELGRGGVATSGRDRRHWLRAGVPQHHIIDPRSGQPATTDVLTATVLAGHAQQAEAAAKVVVILGSQAGLAWLDAQPTLAGLVVREDGQLLRSMRMPPLQN